ncbi:phosphoserine phosphatase SerB [Shewanella sp. Isolate11]|uniref:phosphoserine phosphatase SerB n=1 Tax=Shewanella sp. Isolate11 TaxID=2908530 RepID=UPI001EFDBE31|nr:phosphoserine phosphatase SerB [Shewanella sp. Isolate11]MCG9697320.1 phosphoserine phosphatase SerB [Shewanella sp. Isolate11]
MQSQQNAQKQHQISLFSWIYNEVSQSFEYQGTRFSRHQEASLAANLMRLRVVYSDLEVETLLSPLMLNLSQLNSLGAITRTSALYCVELGLTQALTDAERNAFIAIEGVELVEVSSQSPRLDVAGLLVMDMDSTAIQIECIDELAAMAGVGEAVAEVTERAMQGELDFEQSLRSRVAKLAGADAQIIDNLCEHLPLMPGLREMIAELQSHQWRLVLASGGFTPFVGHLKQLLSLDAAYANQLVIEAGKLTGEVIGTVVDAQFKADTVLNCAEQWHIPVGQRLAIGDGANDIPMVQAADFGIAFHAKPKLRSAADAAIDKLDLRVLPYMLLDLS